MLQHPADGGVTGFVEGDGPLLGIGDELVLLFESPHHAVHGIEEVLLAHLVGIPSGGDQGSLIADVGDVGPAETGRLPREEIHVNRVVRLQRTQVHVENGLPLLEVRHVDVNLAVEASSPHEGAVEDVCPVGRSENDDPTVRAEAVHLRQELVERVLPLVVGADAGVLTPGAAHGVDLIDEDNARTLLLGLFEEVPDPAGPHPDEHLHEVGTAQRKEGHLGLSGHGLGKQGLAGSRRAHEQRPFRNLGPEVGVFPGIFEELDDFAQLLFGPFEARYILEVDLGRILLVEELRLGLADVEDLASASTTASEAAHEHHPHAHHDGEHDDVEHQLLSPFVGTLVGHRHHAVRGELIQPVNVLFRGGDFHDEVRALHQPSAEGAAFLALHDGIAGGIRVPRLGHHAVVGELAEFSLLRFGNQLLEADVACRGG